MNLDSAISEPFARLLSFHNDFNRQVKFLFSSLSATAARANLSRFGGDGAVVLQTRGEPWGKEIKWRDAKSMILTAESFISELGITRASSAFEDYVSCAIDECNRGNIKLHPEGTKAPLRQLLARLDLGTDAFSDNLRMYEFFEVARNCIVHRLGRATTHLIELASSQEMKSLLGRWPKRAGKWLVVLPNIRPDEVVPWQPRHALWLPMRTIGSQ